MTLPRGTRLGVYEILGPIGAGGMGEVYEAADPRLGRRVAIKTLPAGLAGDTDRRARFEHEARAIARLNHPGICAIHDIGRDADVDFIVMELVTGESLATRLRRAAADGAPLSLDEGLRIAVDVADALAAAHAHGVIHRDIKPANVMLTPEGHVKVLDFGLAKLAEPAASPEAATAAGPAVPSATGVVMGTAEYMSPEQALGRHVDERTDIFSFGVLLYEMIGGRSPFRGPTDTETLDRILHVDPPLLARLSPSVPPELERIVAKAMAKDRERRYASARDLAVDLRELLSPSRPEAPARPVESTRQSRKFRVGVAGLAAAVVATMGLAIWQSGTWPFGESGYRSVAVLPFQVADTPNAGAAADRTAYVADGISEELITKLSRLGVVRVVPWMTAQRFRGSTESVQTLATTMNAEAIITGSIRQVGDRLLVTVALVDAATGLQSWGDEFEEPAADLFAVQRRVALGAATGLTGQLTTDQRTALSEAPSRSAEAYELYLRGRAVRVSSRAQNELAAGLYQKAMALDPALAPAYVGFSDTLFNRYYYGWGGDLSTLDESARAAERARALQPDLGGAYSSLIAIAWLRGRAEDGLRVGRQMAERGMENAESLLARADALYFADLRSDAIPLLDRAKRLDPANYDVAYRLVPTYALSGRLDLAVQADADLERRFRPVARSKGYAGTALHGLGRHDEAERYYRRALELAPDEFPYAQYLGVLLNDQGDMAGARRTWKTSLEILDRALATSDDNPRLWTWKAIAYAHLNDRAALAAQIQRVLQRERNGSLLANIGRAWAVVGDIDRAVNYFEEALRAGHSDFYWRHHLPAYGLGQLRDSPRYQEFSRALDAELARLRAEYVIPLR